MNTHEARAPRLASDRAAGIVVMLAGILVAIEARDFTVGFVTDPLGPKAFPLVAAALFVVGGASLIIRPGQTSAWPQRRSWLRPAVATLCLLACGILLSTLGFLVTTTVEVTVFALLLGGRPLLSLASAACMAGALYLLFYYGLSVALPIGSLFLGGGW